MTAAARLAAASEHGTASRLIRTNFSADPGQHADDSADVQYVVWPDSPPFRTAAAMVVHDLTAFVWVPGGDRSPRALTAVYSELRRQAVAAGAISAVCLLSAAMRGFERELLSHGFRYVGDVLTMQCRTRPSERGDLPAEEISAEHDARLARLIDRTYVESLSDPALGPAQSGTSFLARLQRESPDERLRFVSQVDETDAAVCLLSCYRAEGRIVVRYLGVAPEYRGRGLGMQLLRHSLGQVWSETDRQAVVDVDHQNTYAVRVYKELGFRRIASAAEFALPLRD